MISNAVTALPGASNTLAVAPWMIGTTVVAFLLVSVVMILIVLVQRPQGGGLAGAFGSGAGSGQTAFGARTGDALTIATISIFIIYLAVAVGLNYVVKPPAAQAQPQAVGTPPPDGAAAPADTAAPTPAAVPPGDSTAPSAPPETQPQPPAETPAQPAPAPEQPAPSGGM